MSVVLKGASVASMDATTSLMRCRSLIDLSLWIMECSKQGLLGPMRALRAGDFLVTVQRVVGHEWTVAFTCFDRETETVEAHPHVVMRVSFEPHVAFKVALRSTGHMRKHLNVVSREMVREVRKGAPSRPEYKLTNENSEFAVYAQAITGAVMVDGQSYSTNIFLPADGYAVVEGGSGLSTTCVQGGGMQGGVVVADRRARTILRGRAIDTHAALESVAQLLIHNAVLNDSNLVEFAYQVQDALGMVVGDKPPSFWADSYCASAKYPPNSPFPHPGVTPVPFNSRSMPHASYPWLAASTSLLHGAMANKVGFTFDNHNQAFGFLATVYKAGEVLKLREDKIFQIAHRFSAHIVEPDHVLHPLHHAIYKTAMAKPNSFTM